MRAELADKAAEVLRLQGQVASLLKQVNMLKQGFSRNNQVLGEDSSTENAHHRQQSRHPQFINVQNQEEVQLRHRQLVVNSDINEETDGAAYETEDIREDDDELKYTSDAIPLQLESH